MAAYQNYAGVWLQDSAPANSWISGTSAGEVLNGTPANDSFNTGGGMDTVVGGAGDDYYWLTSPGQHVVEAPGGGVDTVNIWSSYTLPDNVENLVINNADSYGAGNAGDNIIQGGDGGSQYLYGGLGHDVLIAGGGGATFVIVQGEGDKVIQNFQSGPDKIRLIGGPSDFNTLHANMTQQGSDVVINDAGTMIALRNITVGQLSAGDFQLQMDYSKLGPLSFDDEFNSLSLGANGTWATSFGDGQAGHSLVRNNEAEIYVDPGFAGSGPTPLGINPFSVANGVATITANPTTPDQQAALWGYKYDSGILFSNYTQLYGYFEMRAELPHGQGLWPAFWLATGANEIDVLEALGSDTKIPNNAIHSLSVPSLGVHNYLPHDDGYHTYGTLWSPQNIVFYIDGVEVWRTATPSDMNQPMHIIANLAMGGSWAGLPDASTPFPAHMNIDYIRAYDLPGTSAGPVAGTPGPVSTPVTTPVAPVTPVTPVAPPPVVTPPTTVASGAGGTITSHGYGDTLLGGSGADTLISNQGGETMTGGSGADAFVFKTTPWTPTHITDFQPGVDRLDVSGLYLDGYKGADPVKDGYVRFDTDGHGGAAVVVDPDGPAQAHLWGDYVADLQGIDPATLNSANLFGGASAPVPVTTPPPGGSGAGLTITSHGYGDTLLGGSGADTLISFQGGETMTGGAGPDVFVFRTTPWTPTHIADFQPGVDRLDVSGLYLDGYKGADPVRDGYVRFAPDGHGGTAVVVDPDGPAQAHLWGDYVADLQGVDPATLTSANVFGSGAAPVVSGPAGQLITSSGPGSTLIGGAGADTLVASQGPDQLTGGAGSDHFQFNAAPWAPVKITDFAHGQDLLDVHGMLGRIGYSGADPVADHTLQFISDGGDGTAVLLQTPGVQWPVYVIDVQHVAPTSMTLHDFLL